GEKVRLLIQESPKAHDDRTLTAAADSSGNISTRYQLDGRNPETQFYLNAAGSVSEGQLRFASAAANLDQCADGANLTKTGQQSADCSWVNGNVNGSKATYFEGDSLPYRLVMTNL